MLTLQENKSVATAESYCEKVSVIAAVFPVFFILVATLAVLGYRGREILGYIYREIMMMAAGAALGVGLGCALVQCVLVYLDFGSLADVQWYSYLASFFLVLLFAGITDLLLIRKILRIDMAESLKANE